MTQPHHHVFNVLQGEINRRVKLAPLLSALQEAGIVPPEQLSRFKREDGMKYMTGYLRSRDYETFVTFIKCMYTTSESGEKNMAIVESVRDVVLGFDERNKTDHAKKIIEILESQKIESKLTTDFQDLSLEESQEGATAAAAVAPTPQLILPSLPYLETPETFTFNESNSFSYRTYEKKYGLVIESEATEEFTLSIGICTHGPFVFPDNYRLVTCFLCISSPSQLAVPLKITMEHCLVMSEYEKCSSVLILHADHKVMSKSGYFTFSDIFNVSAKTKEKKFPDISSTHPYLSFSLQRFCILCAVADVPDEKDSSEESTTTLSALQSPSSSDTVDQDSTQRIATNPSSDDVNSFARQASTTDQSTQDMGNIAGRSGSLSSAKQASFESSVESANASDPMRPSRKRRLSPQTIEYNNKRNCTLDIQYALLLFEPPPAAKKCSVYIFVCHNCPTSIEECRKQARHFYGVDEIDQEFESGVFVGDKLNFEVSEINNRDWSVRAKKTEVVQKRRFLCNPEQAEYHRSIRVFPPKIEYQCEASHSAVSVLKFKVTVFGFRVDDDKPCYFNVTVTPPAASTPAAPLAAPPVASTPSLDDLYEMFESLPYETKNKEITDGEIFLKFYRRIYDWKIVGHHLGLERIEIDEIQNNNLNPGHHELKFEMLSRWFHLTAKKTPTDIAKALKKAGEEEALQCLIHYLKNDIPI